MTRGDDAASNHGPRDGSDPPSGSPRFPILPNWEVDPVSRQLLWVQRIRSRPS
jgi:hypothetical protein